MRDILLTAALRWELAPVQRELGKDFRVASAVLGMGQKAWQSLEDLLKKSKPDLVLLVGLSGGLRPGQHRGDILIPRTFTHEHRDEEYGSGVAAFARAQVFGRLEKEGIGCLPEERGVSVLRMAGPRQKTALGARWENAAGVDMESYDIARLCARYRVPFLAIRAIFDAVDENVLGMHNWFKLPFWYHRSVHNLARATRSVLKSLP